VKSVFAGLQPHLAAMALSPEKLAIAIREANRPIEDPKKIAAALREERESLKSKEDEAEVRRQTAERQKNCPHSDKSGRDALCLTHNWPDRLPRGICPLCHALIHPREWRIGTALSHPERKDHAYIVDEHPLYHRVRSLESMS
jgi:Sec-independent protein translocase protein TatA